ncbi:four helix bundle protein [Tangfeifania diversioriginum]|uniref:Four helix bundle protein n=1 Tax=Tangfeifania diversioriginum TaxID=1168035 RepID=A0A1M6ESX9_9BACT|nr:four helix bundle protein [Tangfeifania diversioriginum]SHI88513.1 four helix bundle protein [Tangfeifania diversioriginum]
MNKFKELKVWQKSIQLVTNIYSATINFPKKEIYGITSQIRRCAVSIPSNIAEGAGRGTKKDFSHFLDIAKDSSFELETQLIISKELGFIDHNIYVSIFSELEKIQKMITGLQKSLN